MASIAIEASCRIVPMQKHGKIVKGTEAQKTHKKPRRADLNKAKSKRDLCTRRWLLLTLPTCCCLCTRNSSLVSARAFVMNDLASKMHPENAELSKSPFLGPLPLIRNSEHVKSLLIYHFYVSFLCHFRLFVVRPNLLTSVVVKLRPAPLSARVRPCPSCPSWLLWPQRRPGPCQHLK